MRDELATLIDSEDILGQGDSIHDDLFNTLDHTKEKCSEHKEFFIDDSALIIRAHNTTGQAGFELEKIKIQQIPIKNLHNAIYENCIGDIYFVKRMAARIEKNLFYKGAKLYREKEDADGSAHYNYDTLSTRLTEIHPIFIIDAQKYVGYQGVLTEIFTEDFDRYPELMSRIQEIDGIVIDGEDAKEFIALDDLLHVIHGDQR